MVFYHVDELLICIENYPNDILWISLRTKSQKRPVKENAKIQMTPQVLEW
jgi:hypothetical protein